MTINELNNLDAKQLKIELGKCCGSTSWIEKMLPVFPVLDEEELLNLSDEKWAECAEEDWLEAFKHHPKIGDINSLKKRFANTAKWASGEQSGVDAADEMVLFALQIGNDAYEQKFGFIFIVFATGKSAVEMLDILQSRMENDKALELRIAAAEQAKITALRLKKLLA